MEQSRNAQPHTLTLEGRTHAQLSGVTAVCCVNVFSYVSNDAALLGERLHIEQLNLEDGQLDVTGEIAGIEYNGPVKRREKRGLFSRKRP